MVMRDPGRPRRNPLFDHTAPDDDPFASPTMPPDQTAPEDDPFAGPWADDLLSGFGAGRATDASLLAGLAALVDSLRGAQPEALEHLVGAAHELVLGIKTVVDAAEASLAALRAGLHEVHHEALHEAQPEVHPQPDDPTGVEHPLAGAARIRRIDLA